MKFCSCLLSGGWDIQHNCYTTLQSHSPTHRILYLRCFPAAGWIRNPQKSLTAWPLRSVAAHPSLDFSTLTLQVSSWDPIGTEQVGGDPQGLLLQKGRCFSKFPKIHLCSPSMPRARSPKVKVNAWSEISSTSIFARNGNKCHILREQNHSETCRGSLTQCHFGGEVP